jgi:heme oxygenase (biliverdin-IX-beta and delta-forming)
MANAILLSAVLRTRTALLHEQIELLLGLPGTIHNRDDYVLWLARFLGIYEPLERSSAAFRQWDALSLRRAASHTQCLVNDLLALGVGPEGIARIPPAQLPDLPLFAHAFGASYVMEGATLGGRLILRDLEARIGAPISGASRFFGGQDDATGPKWHDFKAALDSFGREHPQCRADVLAGAERTFRAMLAWFAPFCAVEASGQ